MYELEVCSDGTTEAQPRSFRQNRPTASTLSDIMHVQRTSTRNCQVKMIALATLHLLRVFRVITDLFHGLPANNSKRNTFSETICPSLTFSWLQFSHAA